MDGLKNALMQLGVGIKKKWGGVDVSSFVDRGKDIQF